ncbi:ABC transporter substrate-binding protein [Candidatus Aerophobetes bacterium]|nr:ABC transporter substrate-binding protein [Candidatus Aerophobetes bacterium]
MRKGRRVVVGLLVFCLAVAGLVGGAFPQQKGKVIKIGCLFALSGPARHIGVPSKYVATMAKEYFEKEGGIAGKEIQLIFADTKGENSAAVTEFERLVYQEKVQAIIGPTRTSTAMALFNPIERAKIPVVMCVGGTPPVVPVKKWIFKTPQKTETAVRKIYRYLKKKNIYEVAIITAKDAFGEEGKKDLIRVAKEEGIKIVAEESFGTQDIDMTIQLRKLVATDAEAIICWTIGPAGATVARNFKSIGSKKLLVQCHGQPDPIYIKLAQDAADGTVMPSTKTVVADQLREDDPQREIVQNFVREYEKKYGPVSTHSGYAWDAFMIVARAIKKAGTEPEKLREAIENTKNYVGVSGVYNMSEEDHCGLGLDSLVMVTVENDKWKIIDY